MRSILTTSVLVLATLVVGSGCSSKSAGDAAAADGTATTLASSGGSRLRAKTITGGGARELAGFHDSLRDEDCTFQPAEPGHVRCLPPTLSAFQGSGLFADAACQVPAVTVAPATCGADVKYAVVTAFGGSCGAPIASELRKVQGRGPAIYVNTTSGCAVQTAAGSNQQSTVSLGDVVAWTDFVEATETVGAGDVLAERVYVATDGARAHAGFRDVKLGVECSFQIMADGVTRCAPEDQPGAALYGDGDCTQAIMVDDYRSQSGCPGLRKYNANLWVEPTAGLCTGLRAVYSLNDDSGVERLDQDVYSWQNDYSGPSPGKPTLTCRSSGSTNNGGYRSQSRRSIASNLTASLASVPRVGSGSARLVPTYVWPAGPSSVLVPGWHDNERDTDCTFALASDGKTRCLPVAAKASVFFTDDACKSTSRVAVPAETECIGASRFALTVSSTCPTTTTVYALSEKSFDLPGASIINGPDRCAKVGGVTAAREATLVDPSQFVEGVASVE